MDTNAYLSQMMFTNEEREEIKFHNEFNDYQNSKRKQFNYNYSLIVTEYD